MTKVHVNDDNDISVIELEIFQNTDEQNISVLSVENVNPKSTTTQLDTDPQNLSINQNTNISNNEPSESSCNKLEEEQKKNEKKETSPSEESFGGNSNSGNHQRLETNDDENDVPAALQLEKEQHEWKKNVRGQFFKKILSNGLIELDWTKHFFYTIATIVICGVAPFPLTLIPVHDVINYPGFWYESPLQMFIWTIWAGFAYPYIAGFLMNIDYIHGARCYLTSVAFSVGTYYLVFFIYFFVWTHVLHINFPMPFHAYIAVYCTCMACITVVYFSFPLNWRTNGRLRRRLIFLVVYFLYNLLVLIQYNFAAKLLINYQHGFQPVAALSYIFIRELNAWATRKLICGMASGDETGAQAFGSLVVGIRYTMQVCYTLGTIATMETEIFLVGFDFAWNIYVCLNIIWVNKRRPEDVEQQNCLLQELAIAELTEFVSPLSFSIAFILAYYGPNGHLIGNIMAAIWHYEAIEDAPGYLKTVLMFFLVDFGSTVVSLVLLWFICKINFLKVLVAVQKEYGGRIVMILGFYILSVSNYFRT